MAELEFSNYLTQFQQLIEQKSSFEICGIPSAEMLEVSEVLERYIEKQSLSYEVHTLEHNLGFNRLFLMAPSPLCENLSRYNLRPDYKIWRDIPYNRIWCVPQK